MNLQMRLASLLVFLGVLGLNVAKAQTQINPKVGLESWSILDEHNVPNMSSHSGQMIGFDMYITQNRFVFAPGFHYHRISILNLDEGLNFHLVERNGSHYFTIPMTFGLQLIDLPGIGAYLLAGGEVTFFHSLDANDIGLDDDKLHGVFAGATAVAQVELLSLLTVDVKYHHALHPIFKARPESKLRGWTIALGVKF